MYGNALISPRRVLALPKVASSLMLFVPTENDNLFLGR